MTYECQCEFWLDRISEDARLFLLLSRHGHDVDDVYMNMEHAMYRHDFLSYVAFDVYMTLM